MYKNYTDTELVELVEKYKTLRAEAQLSLKKEIDSRNIQVKSEELYSDLENEVKLYKNKISSCDFLEKMGFEMMFESKNSFTILRKKNAKDNDFVISLLGMITSVILALLLFYLIINFTTVSLLMGISMMALLGISLMFFIKVTYNAFNRLNLYSDFGYTKAGENLVLRRNKVDKKVLASNLKLIENEHNVSLALDNEVIFAAKGKSSFEIRSTIKAVYQLSLGNVPN